jgi:hypothetical protein
MTAQKWPSATQVNDVLVMTAQSFLNMLRPGVAQVSQFDLMVSGFGLHKAVTGLHSATGSHQAFTPLRTSNGPNLHLRRSKAAFCMSIAGFVGKLALMCMSAQMLYVPWRQDCAMYVMNATVLSGVCLLCHLCPSST